MSSIPVPKFTPPAARLVKNLNYFRTHDAGMYWSISPYYIAQSEGWSCGPASLVMVLNAIRSSEEFGAHEPYIHEPEFLSDLRVRTIGKSPGIGGISFEGLERIARAALDHYQIEGWQTENVRADAAFDLEKLRRALRENETNLSQYFISLVIQGGLTGDPEGKLYGHFISLGAYDREKDWVLMFDSDRKWYEPYWVPLSQLAEAMQSPLADSGNPGGYLRIYKV